MEKVNNVCNVGISNKNCYLICNENNFYYILYFWWIPFEYLTFSIEIERIKKLSKIEFNNFCYYCFFYVQWIKKLTSNNIERINFNYKSQVINLRYIISIILSAVTLLLDLFSEANYYPNRRMEIITEKGKSGGKREWKTGKGGNSLKIIRIPTWNFKTENSV